MKESRRYRVNLEVKTRFGNDYLCYQQVYEERDGVPYPEDIYYRFINRDIKTNLMKAQRGQASIPDHKTAIALIEAMIEKEKRNASWSEEI